MHDFKRDVRVQPTSRTLSVPVVLWCSARSRPTPRSGPPSLPSDGCISRWGPGGTRQGVVVVMVVVGGAGAAGAVGSVVVAVDDAGGVASAAGGDAVVVAGGGVGLAGAGA